MPEVRERRIKVFTVSAETWIDILGSRNYHRVTDGIPQGAKLVGVQHKLEYNSFLIAIEHPSFDPVPIGQLIPETFVVFESIWDPQNKLGRLPGPDPCLVARLEGKIEALETCIEQTVDAPGRYVASETLSDYLKIFREQLEQARTNAEG